MKLSQIAQWVIVILAMLAFETSAADPYVPHSQANEDADDVQRIEIVGGSYFFQPDRVVARAGRGLEISVRMAPGVIPHRFVLETINGKSLADVPLDQKAKTLRFDLPAGKYLFHCPNRLLFFKSHSERGMAGVLEVKE